MIRQRKVKIINTIGPEYSDEAKEILNSIDGHVEYIKIKNQKELKKRIGKYDVAVIGLGLNFDKEVLDQAKKLKMIATASTGTDHIDCLEAKKRGIIVLSLKNDRFFLNKITGTAELAFLLMLAVSRNFLPATHAALQYRWNEKFRGHNLCGKTLGIVGLGRLGTMVAKYGIAFGMKVVACDPYVDSSHFKRVKCRNVTFEYLLKMSDVISIHVHLNQETEGMFNSTIFPLMKKNVNIINTSRGKIVDEDDLLKALQNKQIAGYATDVLADELEFNSKGVKSKLLDYAQTHNNVIITPHVGGVTNESRLATDKYIAKKVIRKINNIT